MECRTGCGACCIVISIGQPFYGMPEGKPAGVPCVHLGVDRGCDLYEDARRPELCDAFEAQPTYCGNNTEQAFARLAELELQTLPAAGQGCEA